MTVKEAFDVIFYWCGVWLAMNGITVAYLKASAALKKRFRRRYMEVFISRELRGVTAAPATENPDEHQKQEAAKKSAESD